LFLFVVLANDKMYSSIVSEYCQHFFKLFYFFCIFAKTPAISRSSGVVILIFS